MIPLTELGVGEEIFEWVLNGDHKFFNITRLRAYLAENPVAELVTADVTAQQAEFIIKNRGIEKRKLDRLRKPWLSQPILALLMADGTTLIVDGHHRYVKLHMEGRTILEALIVPYEIGERFLVEVPPGVGIMK